MKYLCYFLIFLIAFCITNLFLDVRDLNKEISDLKEGYRLLRQENRQLRADFELSNQNAQHVIDEVRKIMNEKFLVLDGIRLIPVWDLRTFLAVDEEELNEHTTSR